MNWAWLQSLKPTIKFVLMALADAADDDGYCWPSVPTLAKKTCMDGRSVQRILKILREANLIQVKAQYRKDGSPTSNKYKLSLKISGDNLSPPTCKNRHGVVAQKSPGGGTAVTQTITESSINHKLPQLPNIEAKKTNESGDTSTNKLLYPRQLTPRELDQAKLQLIGIDDHLAQEILNVLSNKLDTNSIKKSPLAYLRTLVTRAQQNQFTPETGFQIDYSREKVSGEKMSKQSHTITATVPKNISKYLSAMHEVLRPKQKPVDGN